jgi:hypothetical protein
MSTQGPSPAADSSVRLPMAPPAPPASAAAPPALRSSADPAARAQPPAPPRLGRGISAAAAASDPAKSETSLAAGDPSVVNSAGGELFFRPPSPGLGSLHSRATSVSLARFERRERKRALYFKIGVGVSAALLLLLALLVFFLFPRPPQITAGTPTYVLGAAPSAASLAVAFTLPISVDNSASFVPWGFTNLYVKSFNQFSALPMAEGATLKAINVSPRATKGYSISLTVSTAAATDAGQTAILACAQAVAAGAGCTVNMVITGNPTCASRAAERSAAPAFSRGPAFSL